MRRLILAFLAAILATPAVAQTAPPTAPTRDVAITYRATGTIQGKQQDREMRLAITAGGQLMRIEGLGQPGGDAGYLIIDRRSKRMLMVVPKDKHFLELPASDVFSRGFLLNSAMGFTRRGSETVAGLSCTVWEISARAGGGTVCVTDDGVLLRGRGQRGRQEIEATKVTYATQPSALFKPPADYARLDVPPPPQREPPKPPR